MRSARALIQALPMILLLAADAGAQIPSPTGNLYGTVLDPEGKSLPGANVTLSGSGAALTATTDAKGDFRFLNLAPGVYNVTLERRDFTPVRLEVTVFLGKNSVLSVAMLLAGATEAVLVAGDTAAPDTRKTQTGATFPRQELDDVPTTRDPWGVLRQVPGVLLGSLDTGGAQTGQQPQFVGKGSHSDQNTYNLDGVAVSVAGFTPLFFDFDSLDSIGIATGGSDPALSSPGVTLNLVTRRGTNEFRGSARALYTDGARWDYGAEVGGPVWKDRVWLWAAGGSNSYLSQTIDVEDGSSVRYQETQTYWNAKLNAQVVPANALTLSFLQFERFGDGRGASPRRSEASTWDNTFPAESYRLENSQVFSENVFASLDVSYLPSDNLKTPKGGLDTQADQDENHVWRNSFYEWDVPIVQHQAGATASSFFNTGDLRHELRFGFGYRQARWDSASVWPADQLIGYAARQQSTQAAITRAADRRMLVHFYDTYLGDTIAAGNLTLNVGARFDYQQGKNLPAAVAANPVFPDLLPAVRYDGDVGYPITWRTIQPRVGATYAIGRDRRTLLRASYARFADQMGVEVGTIGAFPGTAYLYYGWNDVNGNGRVEPAEINLEEPLDSAFVDPDDPASSAPINQISRDLRPPTTNELIVAVEHQISNFLSASIALTRRSLSNPTFSPLIGASRASYQYAGNASGTVVSNDGFVLNFSEPYYALTQCPAPCIGGTILETRPDARETYSGLEFQLTKALSDGWMLRVSVAYNDWRQQIGPGGIVDPNNELPGTNATGPLVEYLVNSFVFVNARWQFNIGGAAQLPLGIQAGLNLFGREGFPTPFFVEVVADDKPTGLPLIQIGQATDYRTPNVYVLDLQLSRVFMVGSRVSVSPVISCFNVLDSQTVLSRDGSVGTYDAAESPALSPNTGDRRTFHLANESLSGRTIRGGVRISF